MSELTFAADTMRLAIRKTWWILLIQGIAALVIGVLLLTSPVDTLVVLTLFLGAYWLVSGIFDIIGSFARRGSDKRWYWSLISGIIGVIVGLLFLARPVAGAAALVTVLTLLIGVGAIVTGIFQIIWAIRVRNEIKGEGWIIVLGVISIILGIWVLSTFFASMVALVYVAAIFAIIGGIALIIFSFRLRSVAKS